MLSSGIHIGFNAIEELISFNESRNDSTIGA